MSLPINLVSSYIAPCYWLRHQSTPTLVNEKRLRSISITLQGWISFSTDLSPPINREKTVETSRMSRCPVIIILCFSVVSLNGASAVEIQVNISLWAGFSLGLNIQGGSSSSSCSYCIKHWRRSLWTAFLPIWDDMETEVYQLMLKEKNIQRGRGSWWTKHLQTYILRSDLAFGLAIMFFSSWQEISRGQLHGYLTLLRACCTAGLGSAFHPHFITQEGEERGGRPSQQHTTGAGTTCQLRSFLHSTLRCRLVLQPAARSKTAFQPYNERYQFTEAELTLEEAGVTRSGCYLRNQTSRVILYGVEWCYLSTTCKKINMRMLNSIADSLNQFKVHI